MKSKDSPEAHGQGYDPGRLREIFEAACEMEGDERARFIEKRCAGVPALRAALEQLLRADEEAAARSLWQRPVVHAEAKQQAAEGILPFHQLGPYRIVSRIGEGGMGAVYLAERDYDGEVRQRVAVKVIPRAFIDDEMVQRFRLERQILARMEHPNIARMLDAGRAPDGTPYLVMEYVEGVPLNEYAASRKRSMKERIALFQAICEAVGYAHRNQIVHRDLKPQNILVTAEGFPKLLDFGIAKLLSGENTDATSTRVMTAGYASPEQVAGRPITTASDVYSLGVVLWELLDGRRFKNRGTEAGMPSTRDRDLDNILQKALREEPDRRYASAAELAEDLGRYLTGYPVTARPDTVLYRTRKFLSRHRIEAAANAALLLAVLAAGIGFYLRRASTAAGNALPGPRGGRLTMVLSRPNIYDAAISPDGKMLAYGTEEDGQEDLFVSPVAGGERIRLTNDRASEEGPKFSPDGRRILFSRVGLEDKIPSIWIVPAAGGPAGRLIPAARDPAWSPDGARIAFISIRPGEGDALATETADGTDMRIHARKDESSPFLRNPEWSPDGKRLVVVRSTGGIDAQLWLVPLNGTLSLLSHDPPGVISSAPVFTPDGRGIIHQSNRGGATNLWIQPLDGSRPAQLTFGAGPDEAPSVARDGAIVFSNAHSRSVLEVRNLANGNTREVLTHSWYLWAMAFSPDGRDLAFTRGETDGSYHIWIVPVAGGVARPLTSGLVPEVYPRFTPDGSSVIYTTRGPGANRIYRVPAAGGRPEPLTPADGSNSQYGDISPDGSLLAYARSEKEKTRVYVVPVKGGEPRRLIDEESTLPRWSPDGRWLAFSRSRSFSHGGVWVAGADGQGIRRFAETGSFPVWWPGGKQIGYQVIGPDGNEQIMTVPFEGGTPQPLASLKLSVMNRPFDVSADGTLLATTNQVHFSTEIWLLRPQR